MVGHVRNEQRLFSLIDGTLGHITEEQATIALDLFAPGPAGVSQYRAAGGGPDELYDQGQIDWLFRMPTLHLAEAHTGLVYLYELTWGGGHGWRSRRVPWTRRAARARQPDQRPDGHAARR